MRFGASETNCRSCQEIYPANDLDRYLWCPQCRTAVRRRGARWGRLVGSVVALSVAAYLWLNLTLESRFMAFYAVMLVMTYMLTSRIALAVVHGYYRARGGADESPAAQEPE